MFKAIDMFAGAGGLSLGLKMAGWDVQAALEIDVDAVLTHRANMPEVHHLCDDIQDVDFNVFKNLGLIAGGPPCQPFSVSGKQMGMLDARDMVPQFVRAVKEARPTAFLMENVQGLSAPKFSSYLNSKIDELTELGYDVHKAVLNAADFGVPQNRFRLFIIGVPIGHPFVFPVPTHGPKSKAGKAYVSVREALKNVPEDDPNTAKIVYAKNPILRKSPFAGMLLNGQGRPLNWDAPSHTIAASAGGNRTHILDAEGQLLKYHQYLQGGGSSYSGEVPNVRRLTIRESARLQTFPDWFDFSGKRSRQYSQIGNAVPPLLAFAVAKALRDSFDKLKIKRKNGGNKKQIA
jgi:DNA (cytosine-5)-methyltransferase 1